VKAIFGQNGSWCLIFLREFSVYANCIPITLVYKVARRYEDYY